jgi:hypothetical protein
MISFVVVWFRLCHLIAANGSGFRMTLKIKIYYNMSISAKHEVLCSTKSEKFSGKRKKPLIQYELRASLSGRQDSNLRLLGPNVIFIEESEINWPFLYYNCRLMRHVEHRRHLMSLFMSQ